MLHGISISKILEKTIKDIFELLSQGTDCVLEWNEGNHFKEPDLRTAKGFAWLLNRNIGDDNS